ncbi:MAG: hypothetical protein C0169_06735 [Thermodesulfobacterium geofontis]|uniref:Uncharacterized protein n=1 Tax=Thermodesulfobacterium geofontis TaxID=1295609 RepID=A0A2N7Q7U2_9BACT|nr:MAG: hypothetical protein C0169_06735 [Thermodesulfobacterium geofontis]
MPDFPTSVVSLLEKTPNHNTFHYFRKGIPENISSQILKPFQKQSNLIPLKKGKSTLLLKENLFVKLV